MQRIILISGFGSSGKSTCSQVLWDKLEGVAVVEADHLFRIKPFEMATQEGRDQIGRIKLQNTLAVLKTFLKERYANIIVDGLVWSQEELDAVVEACEDFRCKICLFGLKTSKKNATNVLSPVREMKLTHKSFLMRWKKKYLIRLHFR